MLQTSSVESQQSSPGYLPYAVSKWALMAMQEQWYSTHAAENVRHAFGLTQLQCTAMKPCCISWRPLSIGMGCKQS